MRNEEDETLRPFCILHSQFSILHSRWYIDMSDRIIRASEIGQYLFCAKAWHLGVNEGVTPSNVRDLEAGTWAHARHGRTVAVAGLAQRAAVGLLVIGIALAAFWFAGGAG